MYQKLLEDKDIILKYFMDKSGLKEEFFGITIDEDGYQTGAFLTIFNYPYWEIQLLWIDNINGNGSRDNNHTMYKNRLICLNKLLLNKTILLIIKC